MATYKVNATDSKNFVLKKDGVYAGELKYKKWFSFKAEITLADFMKYQLIPKGVWESEIELQKEGVCLLTFKMGWKGIIIKTDFDGSKKEYLLKLKGLFSSRYLLLDIEDNELMSIDVTFKWQKFNFDYTVETSNDFEKFHNKELFILAVAHCINYHTTNMAVV